ncbi:MAG: natural resistance-associated macrophage protein metal ion transporter [Phycisphaerales bacterium]|nr:natural resistance-associated macrophage protein metal ion transporter [Phycisphaerales bacterium]
MIEGSPSAPPAPGTLNYQAALAEPVAGRNSLEEVHRTIHIPQTGGWLGRLFAFAGPAYLVAVGYMDPGNWATDLAAGSRFGYQLIWVLLMSNMMAVLLQTLSARLGVVTGRDLAQACRDNYGGPVRWVLFVLCEIAIAACDLAEVLGTAIGITLLFPHVPLILAVLITGLDVLVLLAMQRWGMRKMEAFVVALIAVIGACFVIEVFLSRPEWAGVAAGLIPRRLSSEGGENSSLYIAIGIIGATVMPHNLYLHSSLVQSRRTANTEAGKRQACRFNLIDSAVALNLAFLVNAAILIVAAAVFARNGQPVDEIKDAHRLLHGLLGTRVAPIAFALALICAGQSSTITGTLAGQITMEGFLHFRMRPWLRRLITRSLAIIPAVIVIWLTHGRGTNRLLVFSQVLLSLQLPFAVVPLVKFTSSRRLMGSFVNPAWLNVMAWLVTALILGLNGKLVFDQLAAGHEAAGRWGWVVILGAVPFVAGLAALLVWMMLRAERGPTPRITAPTAREVVEAAGARKRHFRRIGVALEANMNDATMLAEAIELACIHKAELLLMHVVEGAGGQYHGAEAGDAETRQDDEYLRNLVEHLRGDLVKYGVPAVNAALGFGDVKAELIRMAREEEIDLLVAGGHGHRRWADLLRGETINGVRHGVDIPVLAVRGTVAKKDGKTPR